MKCTLARLLMAKKCKTVKFTKKSASYSLRYVPPKPKTFQINYSLHLVGARTMNLKHKIHGLKVAGVDINRMDSANVTT